MIDHITKSNLQKLLGPQQGACVSIFLSTPHVGLESFDNPTRLKTLLKDAERRLAQLNDPSTSTILLQPVREFLADGDRWRNLEDGLALFSSPQVFCSFRLPGPVDNSVWVGERFHIRPLVPFLKPKDRYYLLAVNQNEVRLFEGTRYGLNENQLTSLPANLVAALNLHPPEGMVEARTASHSVHGKEGAVFHGQGAMSEHQKDDLLAYFRIIDRALHGFLHDKHAPLLFAGVGYLFPIYSQANTYPHLWTEPLAGNPQGLSAVELHRRAVPLLEPHWQRQLIKDRELYQKAEGSNRAANHLEDVLRAAHEGRVEALFVATDVSTWGRFNGVKAWVEPTAPQESGSRDLLELAVYATLLHGGRVHAVQSADLPAGNVALALLRYGVPVEAAVCTG